MWFFNFKAFTVHWIGNLFLVNLDNIVNVVSWECHESNLRPLEVKFANATNVLGIPLIIRNTLLGLIKVFQDLLLSLIENLLETNPDHEWMRKISIYLCISKPGVDPRQRKRKKRTEEIYRNSKEMMICWIPNEKNSFMEISEVRKDGKTTTLAFAHVWIKDASDEDSPSIALALLSCWLWGRPASLNQPKAD